jgi:hypothetical protein
MQHTFLFEPGVWTAEGTFWREDGKALPALGRTDITHHTECWLLSGTMKVLGSPSVEFVNAYSIAPGESGSHTLKWTSENATLGKLRGTFCVVGTCIFSVYGCDSSGYHGAEHLEQVDSETYRSSGILLLQDRLLTSWQLTLIRLPQPKPVPHNEPGHDH